MAFRVKDAMTEDVVTINASATVDDVCSLLLRHHISGLPVVDDDRNLVGIVTELDLLKLLYDTNAEQTQITEFLTAEVITALEDDPLSDIAEIFMERGLRRVPVVRDGRLVGLVSRRDLVRYIRDARLRVEHEMKARRSSATA